MHLFTALLHALGSCAHNMCSRIAWPFEAGLNPERSATSRVTGRWRQVGASSDQRHSGRKQKKRKHIIYELKCIPGNIYIYTCILVLIWMTANL